MGSNIVRFDPIRAMASASITTSYQPIGFLSAPSTPAPFQHAMRVLHFINGTNGDVLISFDGVTDNAIALANTFDLYDLTSDEDTNESFRYQLGTQVYIRYVSAPGSPTNTFYLVAIYGKGE
jgi:hypothetical protein